MKKIFIILFLTFNFYFINKSYSQKIVNLTTTFTGGLDISKHSQIDVINNLPDSNNLGYIPSDILNDRKYIKSSNAITPWLQNFVNKQFGSNANAKANELLWVIQDLSMGKDSTQKEAYSFLKLKADIYSGSESNYQLTNTFDSTWIINGDADFGQMTAAAFIELYKNSVAQIKGTGNVRFQSAVKLSGTKNNIAEQVKSNTNNTILTTSNYADGVYLSFDEFKSNSPSVNKFYADVNPVNKQVSLYKLAADSSSELIQDAWGISVNNELYFYTDSQLYPIEKSGNSFYMAKYLKPRTRKNQAIYWRKIIGSRQGDTNPFNDAHILRRTVPTAKNVSLEATHLDFDTEDFIY